MEFYCKQKWSLHSVFLTKTHCVSLSSNRSAACVSFLIKHLQSWFFYCFIGASLPTADHRNNVKRLAGSRPHAPDKQTGDVLNKVSEFSFNHCFVFLSSSGRFLGIVLKIEEMLQSWFPHINPNVTQTDDGTKKQKVNMFKIINLQVFLRCHYRLWELVKGIFFTFSEWLIEKIID